MLTPFLGKAVAIAFLWLIGAALLLSERRPKRSLSPQIRLHEYDFVALPGEVHEILDDFCVPSYVKRGIVSVEVSPDAWHLILKAGETAASGDERRYVY
jgi:hypothetical protein